MNQSTSPKESSVAEITSILVALGIPAGVVTAFHDFIFAHLVPSLLIGVFYVVIVSSVFKLWQRLVNLWIERASTWIDARVQWFTSHTHREYCQHLFYQHRDFDVKGLSTQGIYTLQLDQVFVELSIVPKPPHQASANPVQVPQELAQGSHAIWDYLASPALANQHLVILGFPGSGKTTLLKHITLSLTPRNKRHRQSRTLPRKLPIFLALREHSEAITAQSNYTLESAVQHDFQKWHVPLSTGWIRQQLAHGKCLVLLDGLDEVADPQTRQQVVSWVQQQMITHGNNRFILTSRPFGYASSPLSGVAVLEVHPFTPKQVEHFVQNWYLANETMSARHSDPGVQMAARRGAEDLLQRLRNTPALLPLAVNPLLLTMIATVHRYRSSLPGKRVELYAEICDVFLGKRQQARGVVLELTAAQQQGVLQPLAYHLMEKGVREIPLAEIEEVIKEPLGRVHPQMTAGAFLRLVEQGSGLLLEREAGIYGFAHLTFQEYLASVHIRKKQWEQMLVGYVGASWWHETIRLYCAQADATAVIAACLTGNPPSAPSLTLAFECQAEALEVQPFMRAQLDALLNQDVQSADPERQRVIAEALLARRLSQMVHLKEETYLDASLITGAEYQLFLDESRATGKYYQPYQWEDLHYADGQGRIPVLGIRRSDAAAFCKWLTERDPGTWVYRLPQPGEVEESVLRGIAPMLQRGMGYWTEVHSEEDGATFISGTLMLPVPFDSHQQQLALEFDLDGILDATLARDSILAIDRVLAHDRSLARDVAHTLARSLTIDRVLELDRFLARDVAHTLARGLAIGHDLDRDRGHSLLLAIELAHSYAHTHKHEYELFAAIDLALAIILNDIHIDDRQRARAGELAADLINILARNFARILTNVDSRDLETANAFTFAHILLDRSTNFTLFHQRDPEGRKQIVKACQHMYLLTKAFAIAQFLSTGERTISPAQPGNRESSSFSPSRFSRKQVKASIQQDNFTRYMTLYKAFVLLEERIQGTFPACEGILIAKERRKEALP